MEKRKTIAVIVGTSDGFFRSKCLTGIVRMAEKLNYNVAVFSAFTLTDEHTKHQYGEENIYELIRSSDIAGYIVVDYSLWVSWVKERIYNMMKSMPDKKCVVFDNEGVQGFTGIVAHDDIGFAKVIDHLIEVHGCKKIYCLTGAEEFPVSHLRMKGYRDSMKRHGLNIEPHYEIFGDFWTMAATELARKLGEGELEMPDAIACANDKSAVTLTNELVRRNIRVPEEVRIVGYDLGKDSIANDPSVTSCTRPDVNTGERCVCELHRQLTGETVEPDDLGVGFFVSGESCGCHRDVAFAREFNEAERLESESLVSFRISSMQESLMAQENFDDFLDTVLARVFLLRNAAAFVLCLNKDWNLFREDDKQYIRDGYQDEMTEALFWEREGTVKRNVPFSSLDLFPPGMLLEDRPVTCYFNSVHFEDRCFGYQVVRFLNDETDTPEDIYHTWSSSVSVSLEYIRMQERMRLMYNRAFSNSIRDGMTGLYNRQGYELYSEDVFNTAKERHIRLLVIVADLDDLKKINDNYGHVEGDNAITVAARALQTCCGNGEYCVRSGGDEFIIFGAYDYDNAIPIFYRSRIDGYLARYNASAEKPYSVGMSAGFFIDYVDDYDNIDMCLKIADERMYANKVSRKKGRM
ncbi:MAG: GGDEF domain-containing protein [Ruminiclostridium sp.]|nr:GGDEF domain-containing protein [Ruminiclostridium sp.]